MTTSQYLITLVGSRDNLKNMLNNDFDVPTGATNKINALINLVRSIDTGIGYMCATFFSNKTNTLTISGINFIPHSFAVSSLYAIENEYSVTTNTFKVIGAISLDNLLMGSNVYTVNMLANEMSLTSIQVTATLTQNNDNTCTLVIVLPETYYFLGENEYAMLGNTHEED